MIVPTTGNDTLIGTSGQDLIDGLAGNDLLKGGNDNDTLIGNNGNDTLIGGLGNDSLEGGDGNDVLKPGTGTDREFVDGGAGIDTLVVDYSNLNYENSGIYYISFSKVVEFELGFAFVKSLKNNNFYGNDSFLEFTNIEKSNITGTAFDDVFIGNIGDTLDGSQGIDSISLNLRDTIDDVVLDMTQEINLKLPNTLIKNFENIGWIDGGYGNDTFILGSAAYNKRTIVTGGYGIDTLVVNYNNLKYESSGIYNTYSSINNSYDNSSFILFQDAFEKIDITGTKYDDTLQGYSDSDTLNGGAGNDSLEGNDGTDIQNSGTGKATEKGGAGNDVLKINYSTIETAISSQNFSKSSGKITAGNNYVEYNNVEKLKIIGTSKNDSIISSNFKDTLEGRQGNDTLNGRGGDDLLKGNLGNDVLIGGAGSDTLKGGDGNDILKPGWGKTTDIVDGGTGTDTLIVDYTNLNYKNSGINLGLSGTKLRYVESLEDDSHFLIFTNVEKANITGTKFNDSFYGTAGDTLDGGQGIDLLNLGLWETTNDIVLDMTQQINLELPDTLIKNFEIIQRIYTGSGNDTFILDSPVKDNTTGIFAGEGTDTLIVNYSDYDYENSGIYISDFDGGYGFAGNYQDNTFFLVFTDIEKSNITGTNYNDSLEGFSENDTLNGGEGEDTLRGDSGNDILDGGVGNDILNGGSGQDTLNGGAGNDTLYGGYGDDTLNGHENNDLIKGGTGNDTLRGNLGDDLLYGGVGNDYIEGNRDNDLISGGEGNDKLLGNLGNDTLYGGKGIDTLVGNDGADVFAIQFGSGKDIISDFENGIDRLGLSSGKSFSDVNITPNSSGTGTLITDNNNNVLAVLSGVDSSLITQADFTTV